MNKCLNYDWVEICDRQTQLRMFVNLDSGECSEAPPEGSRVKPLDRNQWWEFYDQATDRHYYYNYLTGVTVWERPPYGDIIPLARFLTPQHYASSAQSESDRSQSIERQPQPLPPAASDSSRFVTGGGFFNPSSVQRHPSRHSIQGSWASSGHGTLPRLGGQAFVSAGTSSVTQQQQQQQQSETSADSGFDAALGAVGGSSNGLWDSASGTTARYSQQQQQQQQQPSFWQTQPAFPRTNPSAGVYGRTSASLFDASSRSLSVASMASEGASSAYLPATSLIGYTAAAASSFPPAPAYPLPPGWSLTLFRREHNPAKLLCWTRRDLPRPLLAATEKIHKREAADNFKAIQRYMGDRRIKTLSQPVLAWHIVQLGLQVSGMRDEQLMQLCRQLTNNPNQESLHLGWELLAICLAFFPPSGGFAPYLEGFLLRHCQRLEPTCPFADQRQYAGVCYQRLRRILRLGARKGSQGPSVDEVAIAKRTILVPGVFGCSLEGLMLQQRQRGFPELEQPWILTVLTEEILRLGGQLTEGIFRHQGDSDALNAARTQLEQWDLTACRRLSDPRVAASLLTQWLRELAEPLIPSRLYQRALDCHDRPDEALALVARQLSPLNQRVLRHVIRFLRLFAEPNVASVTGLDAGGLALLMAPCIIRCPDSSASCGDFAVDNTRQEAALVSLLMQHLPDYATGGLSNLSVIRDDLPEIDEEPTIFMQQQQQQSPAAEATLTTTADIEEFDNVDDDIDEDNIGESNSARISKVSLRDEIVGDESGKLRTAQKLTDIAAAATSPPLANNEDDCT